MFDQKRSMVKVVGKEGVVVEEIRATKEKAKLCTRIVG
jgi:hypothetical protein